MILQRLWSGREGCCVKKVGVGPSEFRRRPTVCEEQNGRSSSLGEHLRSLPSVCLSDYVNLDEKGGINFMLQKFAGSFNE